MRKHLTRSFFCAGIFAALATGSKAQSCGGSPIQITASSSSICAGDQVTVTISGNLLNNVTVSQGSSSQTYTLVTGSTSFSLTPAASTSLSITNVSTTLFNPCVPAAGSVLSAAVTVTPIPGLPTVPNATVAYCKGSAAASVGSLASSNVSGGVLTFYDAPNGGNVVAAGTIPSTASAGSTTWYVSQKAGANCEGARAPLTVVVHDLPSLSISPSAAVSICAGSNATMTASGAASYSWAVSAGPGPLGNPSNTASIQVSPTGTTTYLVSGTNSNGCSASLSKTVTVAPTPGLTIVNGTSPTACSSSDGQINFSTSNLVAGSYSISYLQNGNAQTGTLLVTGSTGVLSGLAGGNYASFSVSQNGCSSAPAAGPVVLTNPSAPGMPTVPSATVSYCAGATAAALSSMASANVSGGILTFYDAPAGGNVVASSTVPSTATAGSTTWYVSQKLIANCESPRAPITVSIVAPPALSISPSAAVSVCSGSNTTLTASGAASYSWSVSTGPGPIGSPSNAAAMQVSPSGTTTYIVTGTNSSGCSASLSKTVTVVPTPGLTLVNGVSPSNCNSSDGQINFSTSNLAAGSYSISYLQNGNAQTGTLTVTGNSGAVSALPGGSYTNFSVTQNGCSSAVVAGPVTLTNPGSPAMPTVPNANINYCKNAAAAALSSMASANVSGGILTFYDAPAGGNVVAASTIPSTATTGSTTWYVSQKLAASCESPRAPITVTVNDLPSLSTNPSGTVSVCAGSSVTLTASGATTYGWSILSGPGPLGSPSNIASMQVSPTSGTTYTVTGTNSSGCSASINISVSVTPTPTLTVANGVSPSACGTSDGQILFAVTNLSNGTYPLAYQLNGNAQTGSITVTGNSGTLTGLGSGSYGTFSVQQSGCTSPTAAGPVVLTSPGSPAAPTATTGTPVVCSGETILLSAGSVAGASYSWTGPGGFSASGQDASRGSAVPAHSGTYSVTATVAGCSSLPASVSILVKPTPGISSVSPQTICSGDQFAAIEFAGTDQTEFDFRNPDATTASIGLAASGSAVQGILAFVGTNNGSAPVSNTVWAKAVNTSGSHRCEGDSTSFVLTVNPGPPPPAVSTTAPAAPCEGMLYQNFNTPGSTGASYLWTTTGGAQIYAGATSPNALIGFPQAGPASVKLTVTAGSLGCPAIKVWNTQVQAGPAMQTPQIVFVNERLVCLLNTVNGYQWGYDDAQRMPHTLAGETGQDYMPAGGLNSANYYWVLTYQGANGCYQKTYYNKPTALGSLQTGAESLRLYPNPAGNFINLEFPESFMGSIRVAVVDMAGHLVLEEVRSGAAAQINVAALAPGSYFLRYSTADGRQEIVRFSKQ